MMLQLDHHNPEAHPGNQDLDLDPDLDQEIETRENENDQHHLKTTIQKGKSIKTRYFLLWWTVYQMIATKMTSVKILNSLVKLAIVLYQNSGIQEDAEVLDLLDMLKKRMRNMQLNKFGKILLW